MKLKVQRLYFTDHSTIGQLSIDDVIECFTLEPRKDQSQGKPYAIPEGAYAFALQWSPRFQMITPHILSVPGFTDIEIHPGNIPKNTEGCTLVGKTYQPSCPDFVGQSRAAFEVLMAKLLTGGEITYIG